MFTLLFALLFAWNASHAATVFKPSSCASCPPDCPMHKTKRRCHDDVGKGDHCQRRAPHGKGTSVAEPGCKSRADGFTASTSVQLLPTPTGLTVMPCIRLPMVASLGVEQAGFRSRILHPPAATLAAA